MEYLIFALVILLTSAPMIVVIAILGKAILMLESVRLTKTIVNENEEIVKCA